VDPRAAREALGLGPTPTWSEVRAAYRAAIRASHPDHAGGSGARAAVVTEAYAALVRDRRRARPTPAPPPRPTRVPAPTPVREPVGPVEVLDGGTLFLPVPLDEAFAAVREACDAIGDVTYVDRSCAILEALVTLEGEGTCSLVVTFQGRAHGTEAFCTLEAIEHVGRPPVGPVVAALADALAR
jgi:hypothetical protein